MQMEAGSESTTAEPELSTLMYVGRAACVFLSMGLSGFLALVGAFGVQAATQSSPIPTDSYQVIFMGVYMVIFATTIFFFELFQLLPSPLQCVDDMYKRNFGFMYGPIGRGCYLIMWGWVRWYFFFSPTNMISSESVSSHSAFQLRERWLSPLLYLPQHGDLSW